MYMCASPDSGFAGIGLFLGRKVILFTIDCERAPSGEDAERCLETKKCVANTADPAEAKLCGKRHLVSPYFELSP